jgi:hypothetical protein
MSLTQDDKMIHTLAPDRPDQPFGKPILPRRGRCGRLVSDSHGAHSTCDNAAVIPIPIAAGKARNLLNWLTIQIVRFVLTNKCALAKSDCCYFGIIARRAFICSLFVIHSVDGSMRVTNIGNPHFGQGRVLIGCDVRG